MTAFLRRGWDALGRLYPWMPLRLAVLAALAASAFLAFRSDSLVADKPFIEDSYYTLAIARHIGVGHGITADGERATNGFQPLWAFILAPFYAAFGGDRFAGLRVALVLQWVFHVAAFFGVTVLARRAASAVRPERSAAAGALAGLVWLASPHLWRQSYNGLETGLSLAVLVWVAVAHVCRPRESIRDCLAFGALAGIAVLVRIDAALLVVAYAAAELLRSARAPRLARAAAVGGAALFVSSPWWAFNLALSGRLMPQSGIATAGNHWANAGNVREMLDALAAGFVPPTWLWNSLNSPLLWGRVAVLGAALVVALVWLRRCLATSRPVALWMSVHLAFTLALVVWYLSKSTVSFFYLRYLVPAAVVGVPVLSAWIICAAEGVRIPAAIPRVAGIGAALAGIAFPVAVSIPSARAGNRMLLDQVALVQKHVGPGEKVCAGQSGTLGYFCDGVVNLDGKVNADIFEPGYVRPIYLMRRGVRWYCEDKSCEKYIVRWARYGPPWREVDRSGEFRLWRRDP